MPCLACPAAKLYVKGAVDGVPKLGHHHSSVDKFLELFR